MAPTKDKKKKQKSRKKKGTKPINYAPYAFKVLKVVNKKRSISGKGMAVLADEASHFFDLLMRSCVDIMARDRDRQTLDFQTVRTATMLLPCGELGKCAILHAQRSMAYFQGILATEPKAADLENK